LQIGRDCEAACSHSLCCVFTEARTPLEALAVSGAIPVLLMPQLAEVGGLVVGLTLRPRQVVDVALPEFCDSRIPRRVNIADEDSHVCVRNIRVGALSSCAVVFHRPGEAVFLPLLVYRLGVIALVLPWIGSLASCESNRARIILI